MKEGRNGPGEWPKPSNAGRPRRPAWGGEEGHVETLIAVVTAWKALHLVPPGDTKKHKTKILPPRSLSPALVITQVVADWTGEDPKQ